MSYERRKLEPITKPRILIVEGKDEERFFTALLNHIQLEDIQIIPMGGVQKFQKRFPSLKITSGYGLVQSIGIVRDADNSFERAFQSVCGILQNNEFPVPVEPLNSVGANPRVSVFILPDNNQRGMLEDLCLSCVEDDPAMECIQEYFECLTQKLDNLPNNLSKARARAFLVSREFLEDAHFALVGECLEESIRERRVIEDLADISIAKIHLFLASRYKPDLRVGEAAEAGYWPYNHPNFTSLTEFLRNF